MLCSSPFVRAGRLLSLLALAAAAGCEDSTTAPSTGDVRISIATSGVDFDQDGYVVFVDGYAMWSNVPANVSNTISSLPQGTHTVSLGGVAPNCSVDGGAERVVTVARGAESAVAYAVTCVAQFGSLVVTVTTSGDDIDRDGYVAEVWLCDYYCFPVRTQKVGANASITFSSLFAQEYEVKLTGLAQNCAVTAPTSRLVTVRTGASVDATFAVRCTPAQS